MDILLRELDPGQKYILQARAKSATGKTSAWSTAFEHTTLSDTIAPSSVTSLTWDAVGSSFVATWVKPSTDSNGKPLKDFKDYKVIITAGSDSVTYYVAQERFDFSFESNRNSFGDPEPDLDISVQARDRVGNLSIAATDNAVNAVPSDVTGFTAEGISNAVALIWDAVTDTDLKYYRMYVSTSGSGFTPGPSNLIYTGNATSFVFPSTNFVVHYFKIEAVDVFDQVSVSFALDSATPESSAGIDLTPPDDPANVEVTTDAGSNGSSSIAVTWDAVGSSNLSDYLVRYSLDEIIWQYINVPAGQEDALIDNLLPDTDYYVQVAAMSYANVKSDFVNADIYPITTAADTTVPSQPSEPTVFTRTLAAQISHDMTKESGGNLEIDVEYLEVHASESTGFTADETTLQGTLISSAPGIDVSAVFYYDADDTVANLYWKVIAVDHAGNKSIASNQSTGVPGLIENQHIENATITSAKINDLEANKITAGSGIINDLLIKSSLTIDTAGELLSSNWNGTDTGYNLSTTALTIYSGTISAAALLLQDSANIIQPAFADFEFNETYYHTGGVANSIVWSTVGTGVTVDILETDRRFGNNCLRLSNGVITNPTVHDLIFAPSGLSATGVNIDVSPGTYIVSGYFKRNGTPNALLKFGLYPETGSAITSSSSTVSSTSWTRFEAQLVVPSGVTRVKAYIEFGPVVAATGYDFLVDGLQVERKMTGATSAGPWRPPSKTTIDGGQIVTGSIRSSAPSSTDPTQPAWSINTAGNMQVGDAFINGSLVVGTVASPGINIIPDQFASFEKDPSYYADLNNFGDTPLSGSTHHWEVTGGNIGSHFYRYQATTLTAPAIDSVYFAADNISSTSTNNMLFIPGQQYVISAYFKNLDPTKSVSIQLAVWEKSTSFTSGDADPGTPGHQPIVDISSYSTWTRVTAIWTAHDFGSGKLVIAFMPTTTGCNVGVDNVMMESAAIGQTTASTWIAGAADPSYMSSANYSPGAAGWKIDSLGNSEFNKTLLRGTLQLANELGSIDIDLTGLYPTISLWNDDRSNRAYINLSESDPGEVNLGISGGEYESNVYPSTIDSMRSRLFMVDPAGASHLGFVDENQNFVGGQFRWSESTARVNKYDGDNIERSYLYLDDTSSQVGLLDTSSNLIGNLRLSSTQAILRSYSTGGVQRSYLQSTPGGNTFIASINSSGVKVGEFTTQNDGRIVMQGGDGTAFNGIVVSVGGTFTSGYWRIDGEDWHNVSFANSWTNTGGGFANVQYKKTPDGFVHLRGHTTAGTKADGTTLFTLPTGYRPTHTVQFNTSPNHQGSPAVCVQIQTDGQVKVYFMLTGLPAGFTSPGAMSLEGIKFSVI